jgi:N-acetylmuramoyl-L-alanine amidase
MLVKNGYLFLDNGTQVTFKKTPNHGGRKKSTKYLIIHFDAANNATSALSWMLSDKSKVSAELWIGRDGSVVQLLDFGMIAYHAGESEWKGLKGLNSHSIGIELQNNGTQEYTQVQLDTLLEVAKALNTAYKFDDVLGHSDISPGRKVDPGNMFPMAWLRKEMFNRVTTKVTTSDVNLRKGSGTNFESLGVIKKGTEVNIVSEDKGWSEVLICSTKQTGYIINNYLK